MEEKDIDVILVYIKYDFKTREKELFEVEPSEYPFFVKVGPWLHEGELQTQIYLKAKVQGSYQNVDIAVRMTKSQAASVEAVTTQPKGYLYEKYVDAERGLVYFTPPRKGGITGHYTAGGSELIQISFADGRKEWMRLVARVEEEARDFYRKLILDLISMEQKLCVDDRSSMSMAYDLYKETESLVIDFCAAFDALEKNARPELKPFRTKESFHKLKKLSSRALIEHEIFHKEKVSAISYREDLDTFEHRAIKTHLRLLRSLVKLRRDMEIAALEKRRAGMQIRLNLSKDELRERIDDLKKEADKKIEEWERGPKNEGEAGGMDVYIQFHVRECFGPDQGILEFHHFGKNAKDRPEVFVKCFQDTPEADSRQQVTDLKGCWHRIREGEEEVWSPWKKYEIPGAKSPTYIHVSVPMYCKDAASGLFYYMQSDERIIEKDSVVGICGRVAANKYCKVKNNGYAEFRFQFQEIYFFSLFDQKEGKHSKKARYPVSQASEEEKIHRRKKFHDFISESDNLGFYEEALEKKTAMENLDSQLQDEKKRKKEWAKLDEELRKREETSLMKAAKPVPTPVRTSNLFAFHPDYRKMYAVMLADQRKMEGVEYYAKDPEDEFSVARLPYLYEVWCCLKLVEIFIRKYEFRLLNIQDTEQDAGMDSLREYIRKILSGGKINGSRFDLQGNVGAEMMAVTIAYDCKFPLDKEKLKAGGYFFRKEDGSLDVKACRTPDIVLCMQKGEKNRMFILDAKCRGRHCDGIQELCETAFQKYTWELGNGMDLAKAPDFARLTGGRIDGSFILHSCMDSRKFREFPGIKPDGSEDEEIVVIYDPKNYLGAYPDALASHLWKEKCEENKWAVSTDGLTEWARWSGGEDNHENRLGIVAANPKLNKLPHLLQMIMERHFGVYRDRCWLCGSRDLDIKQKMTQGNFPKYHIRCKNEKCGNRTVETHCANSSCRHTKLGKHLDNYLAQQKKQDRDGNENKGKKGDAHWNVSCPKCRQLAPLKSRSRTTSEKIAPSPVRDFSPPPGELFRGRGS